MEHIELVSQRDEQEIRIVVEETLEQFNGQASLKDVARDGVARLVVLINTKLRSVQ